MVLAMASPIWFEQQHKEFSLNEVIVFVSYLLLGWFVLGTGAALLLASVFFGIREEKNLEENQYDL